MMHSQLAAGVAVLLFAWIAAASNAKAAPMHALFISIPLPGHINPLLSEGSELARRGWRVSFASPARAQSYINSYIAKQKTAGQHGADQMQYVNGGVCRDETAHFFDSVLFNVAENPDFGSGSLHIFQWQVMMYPCMYSALAEWLRAQPQLPNIMVVDAATYLGADLAREFNIPFMMNNADLIYLLPDYAVPACDYVPGMMSGLRLHEMGFTQRLLYPVFRPIIQMMIWKGLQQPLDAARKQCGVSQATSIVNLWQGVPILQNSAFGFEYARPVTPLIHMVGPLTQHEPLSAADEEWLNSTATPVVFVSFGTIAPLSKLQVETLIAGLASPASEFRVLWKLSNSSLLPPTTPSNVRIVNWVSSQTGMLDHPRVKVFVSHCGINSAHEAAFYGVSILCIPLFGDQADMALRVEDAGIGLWLDKINFTAQQVRDSVQRLLVDADGGYARRKAIVQSAVRLAGGVTHAANVIEHQARFGSDDFVPADTYFGWLQYYRLDELAIWLLVLLLLRSCCCSVRQSSKQCVDGRAQRRAHQD